MGERRIGNPEGNRSTIGLPSPHPPLGSRSTRFKVKRRIGRALFVSGTCGWTASVGRSRGYWSKVVEERVHIPLRLATGETEGREREREKVAHLPSTATFFSLSLSLSSSILVSYHLLPLQRNWNYRSKIEASTPTHPSIPFLPCLELIPLK